MVWSKVYIYVFLYIHYCTIVPILLQFCYFLLYYSSVIFYGTDKNVINNLDKDKVVEALDDLKTQDFDRRSVSIVAVFRFEIQLLKCLFLS